MQLSKANHVGLGLKRLLAIGVLAVLCGATMSLAQGRYNARAIEDVKAFIAKAEEGDALFNQKKYAEAATALSVANESYQRARRREAEIGGYDTSIPAGKFPALRYFGYGFGSNASLSEKPTGIIEATAAGFHSAICQMWQDACILSGADKVPLALFSDAPMEELTESRLNSIMSELYGPVSTFKLPVPDGEWRDVVLWSRRAKLVVEYALQKYPDWKAGTRSWSRNNDKLQHTGDEALADIKAKLAEAESEYAKIASDFQGAAPKRAGEWVGYKIEDIDKAIASVKNNGWVPWQLARDLFVTKDYLSGIRKAVGPMYAEEGKTMPADALKPLEDKIANLKSLMASSASRWKFSAGQKNAAFESKAASAIKSSVPGATILKSRLDSGTWVITKNDLGIPTYRSMGVLVLAKVPGQAHPWLFFGYIRQTYAGGGTYSSTGTYSGTYDIRAQSS
jgi:hypothetical protein